MKTVEDFIESQMPIPGGLGSIHFWELEPWGVGDELTPTFNRDYFWNHPLHGLLIDVPYGSNMLAGWHEACSIRGRKEVPVRLIVETIHAHTLGPVGIYRRPDAEEGFEQKLHFLYEADAVQFGLVVQEAMW